MNRQLMGQPCEERGCWSKLAWLPQVFAEKAPEEAEDTNDLLEGYLGARILPEKNAA